MQSSALFIAQERRYKLDALCISSPLQATSAPSKPLSIEKYLESHSKPNTKALTLQTPLKLQLLMPKLPNLNLFILLLFKDLINKR